MKWECKFFLEAERMFFSFIILPNVLNSFKFGLGLDYFEDLVGKIGKALG